LIDISGSDLAVQREKDLQDRLQEITGHLHQTELDREAAKHIAADLEREVLHGEKLERMVQESQSDLCVLREELASLRVEKANLAVQV